VQEVAVVTRADRDAAAVRQGATFSPLVQPPSVVLFDLDGTVIDSAPDLAGAANTMRTRRGLPLVPYEQLRPRVGSGARGMVGAAFGIGPGDVGFDAMRSEFLDTYTGMLLDRTRIFDAMDTVLATLERRAIAWGIVTNKHERFTHPIVDGLGIRARAVTVVCGDTTPHAKPHPAPLLEAARRAGVDASRCVYVGDDQRDMEAARAAGMPCAVASWGYIDAGEDIAAWGADAVLREPAELLVWCLPGSCT
jgi:N-acetyl-D-muramate 6-phosphate phosphatase